ncbi:myo-inositol-1-phosphate synthase : Myo-inositol-1-phosphate synthase OS=Pirellula staleyi (strain ATCC 27377 / DSM 6068 / ICPB 4128) GN=Psta_3018 PE=4 SV=1: NAD_binding_5: Inos-1-P_synth [Gemmataceae bacterium]|nr:myo-inositol-1-phosphate synthase : Myo-inositol-1-phosphate synthase OS=Pirellula staleyi (strain ATCC 27377 / DSM 6068 / ICPB 4128) GN=Psta_3018 PE=4 SV=1: NAD_binding_5: Inos-1-P_synth [Gemmataceae bacterium]VTU02314.1 myo-inositol-1-phosphate synthase : Myo-inositol-1-phosphate synthase OS=Pirellula staleyi (strain ATCC 27377 / DSM 6068 / ICPB 4128) GN=Psta_3018 PE=4 SV=1: NAD_binding_5: Inos-1-P_synth [Gemmataceae bacterium]
MAQRRVGLWFIGACGGVASTSALGLSALARGLTPPTGLVTALPAFAHLDLDEPASFVVGGHDIRQATLLSAVCEMRARANVFDERTIAMCAADLEAWSNNLRPGVVYKPNAAITALADRADVRQARSPREAIGMIQADLRAFKAAEELDQLIVVNAASTEPVFTAGDEHQSLEKLLAALERPNSAALPTSSLYAFAALDAGFPYVNLTPSRGATLPALDELARKRGLPHAGQDLKTGETLVKSVLAPLFARRNLRVLSWVGHNILGNRDGQVLNDPENKASKLKSKDALLAEMLGYKPQSIVSIEYVESLDDWKTAWDHIHYEGFLGTKMTMQFTWQGCDSLLAAPLVLDVVRLTALAQRRGEAGPMPHLASFFKSPIGVAEHDFGKQFAMLEEYTKQATGEHG